MDSIADDRARETLSLFVRSVGVLVFLCGLYGAWIVVGRALELLDKPESIVRYAEEVEKQTHINEFVGQVGVLVEFIEKAKKSIPSQGTPAQAVVVPNPTLEKFNAAYFTAWMIVIVLLGLIGKISFWAVAEGGKLAVYGGNGERQLKMVLQQLLAETRAPSRAPLDLSK